MIRYVSALDRVGSPPTSFRWISPHQARIDTNIRTGQVLSVQITYDPAWQAIVDGKLNCSVECNPLLGPFLFDAIDALMAKKDLPKRTVIKDELFDATNAAKVLPSRKY